MDTLSCKACHWWILCLVRPVTGEYFVFVNSSLFRTMNVAQISTNGIEVERARGMEGEGEREWGREKKMGEGEKGVEGERDGWREGGRERGKEGGGGREG